MAVFMREEGVPETDATETSQSIGTRKSGKLPVRGPKF
jgi:hypothetical protein